MGTCYESIDLMRCIVAVSQWKTAQHEISVLPSRLNVRTCVRMKGSTPCLVLCGFQVLSALVKHELWMMADLPVYMSRTSKLRSVQLRKRV
ncbi:hypothetical protein IG631_21960 [Alternaria alternata]|nr:hypothetical protein IG631_21960 [Alternaria alternata]